MAPGSGSSGRSSASAGAWPRYDVVIRVDNIKVASVGQWHTALAKVKDVTKGVFFHVRRGRIKRFFLIFPRAPGR